MSDKLYEPLDTPADSATVAPTVVDAAETTPNKSKRSGAPSGNRNAIRHGLTVQGFPPGCTYIQKQVASFRSALEVAIEQVRGAMGVFEIACIQTAVEWHTHALKARRWVRLEDEKLTIDQRIAYSREIARAFAERDKVLKALGLDFRTSPDAATILYASTANADGSTGNNVDQGTA